MGVFKKYVASVTDTLNLWMEEWQNYNGWNKETNKEKAYPNVVFSNEIAYGSHWIGQNVGENIRYNDTTHVLFCIHDNVLLAQLPKKGKHLPNCCPSPFSTLLYFSPVNESHLSYVILHIISLAMGLPWGRF
jgi:hypothetical protein